MIQTTVNDESLKNSIAVSGALHLMALLLLYFGLPHLLTPLPEHHDPVPFEIVEIADLTNTNVKPQDEQKPPAPPPPKPESKPEQAQTLPPPKPPEQIEALSAEPKPAVKPPPKPVVKPQPDAFTKMLKNLEANKQPEAPKAQDTKADSKTPSPQAVSSAPTLSTRLTISEEDALRRQIEQHWNIPIGARDIDSMYVEIHIDVNPDFTVQQAKIVDQNRMTSDPFFRAFAESALRAVYASSPLELPADKYEQWKGINMTFSAKDVL
jgi:outer membrane biosynthesis protein TonB